MEKIVIDTSIIINGQIIRLIEQEKIKNCTLIIPEAVIDELQSQASQGKEQGFVGLEEIKKIQSISNKYSIELKIVGQLPNAEDIKLASHGRIDAIIKEVAKQNNAYLFTSDRLQSLVAQAEGIQVHYESVQQKNRLEFLKFFDSDTMSVHLKEGLPPMGKRGKPGSFLLTKLSDDILSREYLREITTQILESSKLNESGNIEISQPGALVIQHGEYRIAITQQPFSESYEITIVHPIVKLALDEYGISEKLMDRFSKKAEGVLISGPPGSGKSTLASGLADFYNKLGKIVKTFESPRDLQVDKSITQYTRLDGSFENSADILLLVRPDYTIFDEVRRKEDFRIFADLRLSGVGMVGVVHANSPLDAVQRFIGKIELGIIPNVIDTVVFIKDGKIGKVHELELKVKVPSGMVEQDLARPVIEIRDFENNRLEYEIYTFGEENVVVPVSGKTDKFGIEKLAEDKIKEVFRRFDPSVQVQILSDNRIKVMTNKENIPSIIGRGGSTINELEKMLKLHIDVEEKTESEEFHHEIPFSFGESKNALIIQVPRKFERRYVELHVADKFITSSRVGNKGQIKIPKKSDSAKSLMQFSNSKNDIKILLIDS